jgi:hypothetical protein
LCIYAGLQHHKRFCVHFHWSVSKTFRGRARLPWARPQLWRWL